MKKNGKSIQMALALLAVGTLLLNGCSAAKPAEKKSIRIGVTLYRGEDAFINNIRSSLEEKAKEYDFSLWLDGADRAGDMVYAAGRSYLVLVRDESDISGRCRERIRTFAAKAAAGGARVICAVGTETPGDAPAGADLGAGAVYGMDRRLMAQMLRADAGAVEITDGVITDRRPCRTMEKMLE